MKCAALLQRAVENPEVAGALPATVQALATWDRCEADAPAASNDIEINWLDRMRARLSSLVGK